MSEFNDYKFMREREREKKKSINAFCPRHTLFVRDIVLSVNSAYLAFPKDYL